MHSAYNFFRIKAIKIYCKRQYEHKIICLCRHQININKYMKEMATKKKKKRN